MNILTQLSHEIEQIVQSVLPSIVEIRAWRTRSSLNPMRLFGGDEYEDTAGAGVIIRPDGVILTNYHIIAGAARLSVKLQDGRTFEPEIVGRDQVSDIAVLRVTATDLVTPPIEADRSARLGEMVFAIGHPLGFTATVTMGIVSAEPRFSMGPSEYRPSVYIQTDASINPGNSGGALVGTDGRVLGINTWGVDPSEGENLAFAIPIKTALRVAEKLLQAGSIAYGTIGVSGVDSELPAAVVTRHNLSQSTALLVLDVEPDGSAEKAGIKEFDWILAMENRRIEGLEVFLDILDDTLIGKTVQVQILRGADFSLATKHVRVAKLEIEEES